MEFSRQRLRQLLRFFLLFIFLLVALSGCTEGKRYNVLRPNDIVLAFGNSLTRGTGADEHESYPAQLQELIRRTVVNAGIPGEITAEGRKRLPETLDEVDPDMLILCHGGNDMLRRLDRKETIENIKAMVAEAQSRDIPVILVAVPQFGLMLDAAPFYKKIADQYNVPLVEDALSEILSDRSLKSDTIHPNAAGYREMAVGIADTMKAAGAL